MAIGLLVIYAWYVQATPRRRGPADGEDELAPAAHAPARPARSPAPTRTSRGCGSSPSRSSSALACIVGGAWVFVQAVEALSHTRSAWTEVAPGPGDRPDRDRAAREVQLRDLGPPGQGHAGDGQHHRRDGLPEHDPDRHRPGLRGRDLAGHGRTRASPSPRPGSPSSRRRSIFLPMARRGRAAGRGPCWSAARSTSPISALVAASRLGGSALTGVARPGDARPCEGGPAGAAGILEGDHRRPSAAGAAHEERRLDADREARRAHRPGARARRSRHADLLLRGVVVPMGRGEGQHHDPRLHVRHGGLRGHPGLLERRSRGGSTACSCASTWSASGVRAGSCSWNRSRPSTSWSGSLLETARRNAFREDVYIRPSFYKSTRAIGVRLHHLEHQLYVIAVPFGDYIDVDHGIRVMTSSWRRNADEALPARGKIVGGYVNMAFQKIGGRAQRLRRGHRPDSRRPRLGGLGGEPLHASATVSCSRRR